VTILFADLRGFTAVSEQHYPYDVVFLLNRYFTLMSAAIERNGGVVDKFIGDAVMAIFGLSSEPGRGSREALLAAREMEQAMEALNREMAPVLAEPLRMGIGMHMGPAILGRVGSSAVREDGPLPSGARSAITALGDTVNIASRLESATKDYGCFAVLSEETLQASGLALQGAQVHEVVVRGRTQPLRILALETLAGLETAAAR